MQAWRIAAGFDLKYQYLPLMLILNEESTVQS